MSESAVYLEPEQMALRDYASVLRRRKWIMIIPMVVVCAVAFAMSVAQTKQYRSSTEVLVKEPPSATAIGAPERPMQQRVLQNELQRAQGSAMRDQVRQVVGPEPRLAVGLAATEDVDVFVFTGASANPELAAIAADAYAQVYIDQRRASLTVDLEAQAQVIRNELASLDEESDGPTSEERALDLDVQRDSYNFQLGQLETSINLAQKSGASVIDAAQVPTRPYEPTPRRNAALGLIVGTVLGLAAALLVDHFDNSLRDENELAQITGLAVLGVIPQLKDWKLEDTHLVSRELPSSAPAEAYRAFRAGVHFLTYERDMRIIQVTSPQPGDGKTTTSTNLAVASARAGQRVLLIDCDLRRPRVHKFFGLTNVVGFTTMMVGGDFDEIVQHVDGEPNLSVISSGPILPDPAELLSGATAQRFIRSMRDRFDLVIIDSPPVLAVADPLVLSAAVDGVIIVASAAQSDKRDLGRAMQQLQQLETPMLGAVLNSFDTTSSADYRHSYGVYEPSAS